MKIEKIGQFQSVRVPQGKFSSLQIVREIVDKYLILLDKILSKTKIIFS
ncbi:unnamed protein product [Paramecium sonneborni]|uniref:Uncharacterized protein n=1 Tax=Paramecium sonneborni TaxID=65129 RepID=A0A8S1MWH6_9CILI|nr:unnamed protein product [Paramecium sonneborni]